MDIKSKVALVTGAAGGIGLSIASFLLRKQVRAIGLVDISPACLDIAESLKNTTDHSNIKAFTGDVCDPAFRETVFRTMEAEFGPVEICVPAAGILRDGLAVRPGADSKDVALYRLEDFRQVIDVNLVHPTYWAMETIAGIARRNGLNGAGGWHDGMAIQAVNILIGSVSSRGNRGQISYSAAKSGLCGASVTLNKEGLYHGVLTKIIHPGFVDTPMVDQVDPDYFDNHLKPDIGLGRKIHPDEIAECIGSMIENDALTGELWASASLRPFA